jgi:hypothetical protein
LLEVQVHFHLAQPKLDLVHHFLEGLLAAKLTQCAAKLTQVVALVPIPISIPRLPLATITPQPSSIVTLEPIPKLLVLDLPLVFSPLSSFLVQIELCNLGNRACQAFSLSFCTIASSTPYESDACIEVFQQPSGLN